MNRLHRVFVTVGAAIVFGAGLVPSASASCGYSATDAPLAGFLQQRLEAAGVAGVNSGRDGDLAASIVGLWSAQFFAKDSAPIPDGVLVDDAYVTWHSDGTELMNSGRPPITGSFCMGVWKQTGRSTYKLNHVAKSWDPSGTVFVGPANIREMVTLDRGGDTYRGTFTIDQFDQHGNPLAHVAGVIVAHRITPN